jgi:hypothetical protein
MLVVGNMEKELIICSCHSTEHQMVFIYDRDENYPMVYIHYHLNKRPFWGRVVYGIKYIFGRQSRYGAFDEIILKPEDTPKFEKVVEHLNGLRG